MMRQYKYFAEHRDKVRHLRPHEVAELRQAVRTANGEIPKSVNKWRKDTRRWREAIEAR